MKDKFIQSILQLIGVGLFLSAIACATRSTPPAPVVNANISAYPHSAAPKQVAAPAPEASNKSKLQAVTNDEDVQATSSTQQSSSKTVVAKQPVSGIDSSSGWRMPTEGTLGSYSAATKGVNIPGQEGQAIYAVSSGKVLYSGNGLKGYGNLIIIRHDNSYLSAYAYNKANLVKEGANVQQGQKIATMGLNDSNQAMLHFEVRKNGKPIDPHSMIGN